MLHPIHKEVKKMASNATQYNNLTPAKPLDQKTLNKMVWRSMNLQASFNYERMQAVYFRDWKRYMKTRKT